MMCLGWFNQVDCKARPGIDVLGPTQTAAEAAGITTVNGSGSGSVAGTGIPGTCNPPLWFWLIGAGIVGMGLAKK